MSIRRFDRDKLLIAGILLENNLETEESEEEEVPQDPQPETEESPINKAIEQNTPPPPEKPAQEPVEEEKKFEDAPVAKLSSGLVIANLSSGHPFEFDDGTKLQGCSRERMSALSIRSNNSVDTVSINGVEVQMSKSEPPSLTSAVEKEIGLILSKGVDLIMAPRPIVEAAKNPRVVGVQFTERGSRICKSNSFFN